VEGSETAVRKHTRGSELPHGGENQGKKQCGGGRDWCEKAHERLRAATRWREPGEKTVWAATRWEDPMEAVERWPVWRRGRARGGGRGGGGRGRGRGCAYLDMVGRGRGRVGGGGERVRGARGRVRGRSGRGSMYRVHSVNGGGAYLDMVGQGRRCRSGWGAWRRVSCPRTSAADPGRRALGVSKMGSYPFYSRAN